MPIVDLCPHDDTDAAASNWHGEDWKYAGFSPLRVAQQPMKAGLYDDIASEES